MLLECNDPVILDNYVDVVLLSSAHKSDFRRKTMLQKLRISSNEPVWIYGLIQVLNCDFKCELAFCK